MSSGLAPDLRCAAVMRAAGADPVGTAGSHDGFAVVGWPLPWPDDLGAVEALAPVREVLAGTGIRLQAVVPDDPARQHLALWRRAPGAAGYVRSSAGGSVAGGDPQARGVALATGLADLLAAPAAGGAPPAREVLVCTHGRRDRCCGSMGTELWQAASAVAGDLGVALRRTSHTGGHRFAPTFLVLPEGTMWGFGTLEVLEAVLRRSGPVPTGSYRGCTLLGGREVQALERAVLAEVGWALLDRARRGVELGGGRWRLEVAGGGAWEGQVRDGRRVPVPECGVAEAGRKVDVSLVVEELRRVGVTPPS